MATITQTPSASRKPTKTSSFVREVHSSSERARLKETLTRQRTSLLTDWNLSLGVPEEQPPCADLADQASNDLAQDLAIRVRMRVLAKLRRIERALLLMRTKSYGCCQRCRKAIPYERLAVQPDARFCVPCLARVEGRASRN
jgi:DnaK suppressor protein